MKLLLPPLLVSLVFLGPGAIPRTAAQAASIDAIDGSRTDQVAALGRVWGVLHFFHPAMPAKQAGLDEATRFALRQLDGQANPRQFEVALRELLAAADDPVTHLRSPVGPLTEPQGDRAGESAISGVNDHQPASPGLRWEGSIAIVDLTDFTALGAAAADAGADVFRGVLESCSGAAGVVFDLRRGKGDFETAADAAGVQDYFFRVALREAVAAALLTEDLVLPTIRTRTHSGYASKLAMDTGGFHSGFQVANHFVVSVEPTAGTRRRGVPPWMVLCNRGSRPIMPLVTALQSAGIVRVIQDGDEIDLPVPTHEMALPHGFTAVLRLGEMIQSDGSAGFEPDLRVSSSPGVDVDGAMSAALAALGGGLPLAGEIARGASPVAGRHPFASVDPKEPFPDRESRLLGLFRLWNVIGFFYPHLESPDESWLDVLRRFVSRFEQADDPTSYSLAVAELVANLRDSRATVHSDALRAFFGEFAPPVRVRFLKGGTCVVTDVFGDATTSSGLSAGDLIESVDGQSTRLRVLRLSRYLSASNDQGMRSRLEPVFLSGKPGSVIRLGVRDRAGGLNRVTLRRTVRVSDLPARRAATRITPVYGVLGGSGYLDLTRLKLGDVGKAVAAVSDTPGTVLDLRGPVKTGAWELVRHLTDTPKPAALFLRPYVVSPDPTRNGEERFVLDLPVSRGRMGGGSHYPGRLVALIDGRTRGQSEHSCLLLEAASENLTYIGSATGGALGDLTEVTLPGGVRVRFPGDSVRRPDGSPLQRVGIHPDIAVEPTPVGIRNGIDEVLEEALRFLDAAPDR